MRTFIKQYWALFIPILVLVVAIWFLFRKSPTESNAPWAWWMRPALM
ncbi:hypothetical protein [Paraflavitalea speifideaquila]|nr:hypothetical protein [Paraflavitalea speifideiaquila]